MKRRGSDHVQQFYKVATMHTTPTHRYSYADRYNYDQQRKNSLSQDRKGSVS